MKYIFSRTYSNFDVFSMSIVYFLTFTSNVWYCLLSLPLVIISVYFENKLDAKKYSKQLIQS